MPGHVRKMQYPDSVASPSPSLFYFFYARSLLFFLSVRFLSSLSLSLSLVLYLSLSYVYGSHSLTHREPSIQDAPRQPRRAAFHTLRHSPLRRAVSFGEYIMQ